MKPLWVLLISLCLSGCGGGGLDAPCDCVQDYMNKVESSRHSGNYPNEKVMKEFQVKMNNYGQKTPEIKEKVFTLMKNTISWGLGKQSDEAVGALGTQSQYHESKALTYQALNRIKEICPNIKEP